MPPLGYIKPVWQVYQEDGPEHDNDDAHGADPNENTSQNRQPTGKLRQSHEESDDDRGVHKSGEPRRAQGWPLKPSFPNWRASRQDAKRDRTPRRQVEENDKCQMTGHNRSTGSTHDGVLPKWHGITSNAAAKMRLP
jgi:hypothetical protein